MPIIMLVSDAATYVRGNTKDAYALLSSSLPDAKRSSCGSAATNHAHVGGPVYVVPM